ncbi:hypothetical protein EMIT07CA2_80052 [Brevibacillus sp. IT-7CA2]
MNPVFLLLDLLILPFRSPYFRTKVAEYTGKWLYPACAQGYVDNVDNSVENAKNP